MPSPLRALRHRNFAWFTGGQTFALLGYWVQQMAQSWLLYRLTDSALMLGLLGFAASIPVLFLSPFAGIWADRVNLHRTMFVIQVCEGLQATLFAVLAVMGLLEPWHVVLLAGVLGVLIALELPVRHAYLLELVDDRADLPNAVAVTSLMANCGRLVGPAVAGVVIGALGEAMCFVLNAATYLAVIVSLIMIRVVPSPRAAARQPFREGFTEGVRHAWHSLPIRLLLGTLIVIALLAAPYVTVMPVLVREVFRGGATQMGFLIGSAGVGAVAGTLLLAARRDTHGLVGIMAAGSLAAGLSMMTLPFVPSIWMAAPLLAAIGFGLLVTSVSVNMILQSIVDDDKRGRIMSLYTACFLGVAPFGSLLAGMLTEHAGVRATLAVGGTCCAIAAFHLHRRRPELDRALRPLYLRAGRKSE